MAAKNPVNLLGNSEADTIYAASVETSPSDWAQNCGVCHAGGGQMEYDRDGDPYSETSPIGDQAYFRYEMAQGEFPQVTGMMDSFAGWGIKAAQLSVGQTYGSNDAGSTDTGGAFQLPGQSGMIWGDNNVEVDCMMCHSAKAAPGHFWFNSMNWMLNFRAGAMPGGDDEWKKYLTKDADFYGADYAPGQAYDMYNRNEAIKNGQYKWAAAAGLGATLNSLNGDSPTDNMGAQGAAAGMISGTNPTVIAAADIVGTPKSEACAVCHARDDSTQGLPGMAVMKFGYGNYAQIMAAGTEYDVDDAPANADGDVNCQDYNLTWNMTNPAAPVPVNGIAVGNGTYGPLEMSVDGEGNPTSMTWYDNRPVDEIEGDCRNDILWFELGCKTGMGKRAHRIGTGSNNVVGKFGQWVNPVFRAAENLLEVGQDIDETVSKNPGPMASQGKMDLMSDTDVHDVANLECATCHYAVEATFPAVDRHGIGYLEETVYAIDHQFAQADNYPDVKSKNNLDGMVSCEACHIDGTHPHKGSAMVPAHAGFPALHFEKIACATCHIPEVYAAPGRLKYRDWTMGLYKNGARNMLDWNYHLPTGSHRSMPPIRDWYHDEAKDVVQIKPYLPSVLPVWFEKVTVHKPTGDEIAWGPMKTRDVDEAVGRLIVKQKAQDLIDPSVKVGLPARKNKGNVVPIFDGFALADGWEIGTQEEIDMMVDELRAVTGREAKLVLQTTKFDVTHGVVPKTYALGSTERGGCASCHSSMDPQDTNYSPFSVGFFEGYQHTTGNSAFNGGTRSDYDMLKNWFAIFVDYDSSALLAGMMTQMGMSVDTAAADGMLWQSVAATTSGLPFAVNMPKYQSPNATSMECTDTETFQPIPECVPTVMFNWNTEWTWPDAVDCGALSGAECEDAQQVALREAFAANQAKYVEMFMALTNNNPMDPSSYTVPMQAWPMAIQMTTGFDMMMEFDMGTAWAMRMFDGVEGLMGFLVNESDALDIRGVGEAVTSDDDPRCDPFMMAGTPYECTQADMLSRTDARARFKLDVQQSVTDGIARVVWSIPKGHGGAIDMAAGIADGESIPTTIGQNQFLGYTQDELDNLMEHAGKPADSSSTSCAACHSDKTMGFHAMLGAGAPTACTACHAGDSGADHYETIATPAAVTAQCGSCHIDGTAVELSQTNLETFAVGYHDNAPVVNGAAPADWDAETMNATGARFNWYKAPACNTISVDACMNEGSSFTWTADGDIDSASSCATTIEFASAGLWNVTLTTATGTRSQWVNVSGTAAQPTAAMDVIYNGAAEPLTITVTDNSGTNGCASENGSTVSSIIWGDGTVTTGVATTDEVEHTYTVAGTYVVRLSTRDSGNGRKSVSAPVTVVVPDSAGSVFTVTGTILKHPENTGIKNVNIYLKDGTTLVKHAATDADGNYAIYNVAPLAGDAAYTIVPQKNGYTFSDNDDTDDSTSVRNATSGESKDFSAHTAW